MTNKKHSCSNTEEYIDAPEGPRCACGKPISDRLRAEIDLAWEKGKKERLIEAIKTWPITDDDIKMISKESAIMLINHILN